MLTIKTKFRNTLIRTQSFPVNSVVRIGRDPRCDIHLSPEFVSRIHAKIEITPEAILLIDNGSANGVSVDGRRTNQANLIHGSVIQISDFELHVLVSRDAVNFNVPTIQL